MQRLALSIIGALVLMGTAVAQTPPQPGHLYGIDYTAALGQPFLVRIDPTTYDTESLGLLTDSVEDLEFDPATGALFGAAGESRLLVTVDPITGALETVGVTQSAVGDLIAITALAFHPDTGELFGADGLSNLYRVDAVTAEVELIGFAAIPALRSIAFHPTTGLLYATNLPFGGPLGGSGDLWTIDPDTAGATLVGSTEYVSSLAFDAGGTLFGADTGDRLDPPTAGPSALVTVDVSSGDVTPVATLDLDNLTGLAFVPLFVGAGQFRRGDANVDGQFDISDAVFSLSALFVPGSPASPCADAADANDDAALDISDPVYTLAALFTMGASLPPAPHPDCGTDPTIDALACAAYDCP